MEIVDCRPQISCRIRGEDLEYLRKKAGEMHLDLDELHENIIAETIRQLREQDGMKTTDAVVESGDGASVIRNGSSTASFNVERGRVLVRAREWTPLTPYQWTQVKEIVDRRLNHG